MKILYLGTNNKSTEPVDRRRGFGAIENIAGLNLVGPSDDYDVIFVGAGGDLAKALVCKAINPSARLVYDYANHYLEEASWLKARFRPISYSIVKKYRLYLGSNRALIREVLSLADQVVCASDYQRHYLSRLNISAYKITDVFDWDFNIPSSENISIHESLFWEGKAFNLPPLLKMSCLLNSIKNTTLNVVTDKKHGGFFSSRLFGRSVEDELIRKLNNITYRPWSVANFNEGIFSSSLGLLPLDISNKIAVAKPENRLVLMWRFGRIALCSDTPAHRKICSAVGENLICKNDIDWSVNINKYKRISKHNLSLARKLKQFADHYYSEQKILMKWKHVFENLG